MQAATRARGGRHYLASITATGELFRPHLFCPAEPSPHGCRHCALARTSLSQPVIMLLTSPSFSSRIFGGRCLGVVEWLSFPGDDGGVAEWLSSSVACGFEAIRVAQWLSRRKLLIALRHGLS